MKCPNCGANIEKGSRVCDYCNSILSTEMQKELEQENKERCPKCNSTNIEFKREKQAEYNDKKGKKIIYKTVGYCKDCGYTWFPMNNDNSSGTTSNLWLWVLGWIFIFPLPLTILLLKKKDMKNSTKYIIIACAWIFYILIGVFGRYDEDMDNNATMNNADRKINNITVTSNNGKIVAKDIKVVKDEEFGAVHIGLTIDEFNELGFSFGDSLNISFSNGFNLEDVPYYSGYYVPVGEKLCCGYPGYPHVAIARNFGDSMWTESGSDANTTITVSLNEKGKYKEIQDLFNNQYSDERSDYKSDTVFSNYREIKGGNIAHKKFYRGASPCDNSHNRANVTDNLLKKQGINYILNISDSEEEYLEFVKEKDYSSDYTYSLYKKGNISLMGLGADYKDENYEKTIAGALLEMTKHKGPYYIHCLEGKDRTGFVSALILALADASYDEIINDYMITYDNYYGVSETKDKKKYDATVKLFTNDMLHFIGGFEKDEKLNNKKFKKGVIDYLKKGGLNDIEIKRIIKSITGGLA